MEMAIALIELLPYRVTEKSWGNKEVVRRIYRTTSVHVSTIFVQRKLSQGTFQEEQAYRYLGRNC